MAPTWPDTAFANPHGLDAQYVNFSPPGRNERPNGKRRSHPTTGSPHGAAAGSARYIGAMHHVGGVEAGGTKFICVIGRQDGTILTRARFPTDDPALTLAATAAFFRGEIDRHGHLAGIGVAAFGPLELRPDHPRFGTIGATPKPGWAGADMLEPLRGLGVPLAIDTDVNGAALAEARWGAAQGCDQFVYLTVGTGIGAGVIIDGRPLHGVGHPEAGHVTVPREPADDFPGVCPFHGDCLEGLASGPAMAARWGRSAELLSGAERDAAIALEAGYLAAGIRTLIYTLAPQRVVIGGGVSALPGLIEQVNDRLRATLNGYPGHPEHERDVVVLAGLGDDAGPAGSLALATIAATTGGRDA